MLDEETRQDILELEAYISMALEEGDYYSVRVYEQKIDKILTESDDEWWAL